MRNVRNDRNTWNIIWISLDTVESGRPLGSPPLSLVRRKKGAAAREENKPNALNQGGDDLFLERFVCGKIEKTEFSSGLSQLTFVLQGCHFLF